MKIVKKIEIAFFLGPHVWRRSVTRQMIYLRVGLLLKIYTYIAHGTSSLHFWDKKWKIIENNLFLVFVLNLRWTLLDQARVPVTMKITHGISWFWKREHILGNYKFSEPRVGRRKCHIFRKYGWDQINYFSHFQNVQWQQEGNNWQETPLIHILFLDPRWAPLNQT